MNDTSTVPVTTSALEVPGARLHYEVRGWGALVVIRDDKGSESRKIGANPMKEHASLPLRFNRVGSSLVKKPRARMMELTEMTRCERPFFSAD